MKKFFSNRDQDTFILANSTTATNQNKLRLRLTMIWIRIANPYFYITNYILRHCLVQMKFC